MSDISGRLKEAAGAVRDKAEDAADSILKSVDETAESLRSTASEATKSVRDAAIDTTVSVSEAIKVSIERQPFTAVTVAAVAGFVFGMFFFRRT